MKKKMETVAKGIKKPKVVVERMRKKEGGSNVGKYDNVKKSEFAGPSGGAPQFSFPINTKQRAKSALKLAYHAPNPAGIKRAVYKKYPDLKPKSSK